MAIIGLLHDRSIEPLLMDVPDMDAFASAMQSEAAAEAMKHDSVLPETMVILVEG